MEGHFFHGDLHVDVDLECYRALNLRRVGGGEITAPRDEAGIKLAGKVSSSIRFGFDIGTQLGATYVVNAEGKVLLEHRQDGYFDFMENSFILKALGIEDGAA